MRHRWIVLLTAALCCGSVAARADILQPSPIPSPLADRDDLALQRSELMTEWQALEQAIAAHNAQCSEVPEDSPQVEACQASQAAVLSDVETYKERLQQYEEALAQAMALLRELAAKRYARTVACAVEPLYRHAEALGPEGRRFATMVRQAIEEQRGELADFPPGTVIPLHVDHHPDDSQFLADINMVRGGSGDWRLDVQYSLSKTVGQDEQAGASYLILDQDGQLVDSEAPSEVQRCVESQ